nr:hypothetical protein [Candidatus Sigynarchaeota archaeon]
MAVNDLKTMDSRDAMPRAALLGSAMFAIQGIFWLLGILYLTTIQLEMIYPYITTTVLAWVSIVPAYNFAIACWSAVLGIVERRRMSKINSAASRKAAWWKVHAAACLPCIPFGPIVATYEWQVAKSSSKGGLQPKPVNATLSASLGIFYVTGAIIAAVIFALPAVLDAGMLNLIYPYSMIATQPIFAGLGTYYICLIAGDIILSTVALAARIDPFTGDARHAILARFIHCWLVAHAVAIPVGPFIAALAIGFNAKD